MGQLSVIETISRALEEDKSITVEFRDKVIFIFSPQPWNYLQISKHHYARALAAHNRVYFIIPPVSGKSFSFSIDKEHEGLYVVNYTLAVPSFLRFKLPALYKLILRAYLSRLLRAKLPAADVAFDFGCYQQFDSLGFVSARHKILFPVDELKNMSGSMRGCDVVFSVSNTILKKFKNSPAYFINHGLSDVFAQTALYAYEKGAAVKKNTVTRVGYAGNLFIRFLDRKSLAEIIQQNEKIEFHLFGEMPSDIVSEDDLSWKNFLRSRTNVILHGFCDSITLSDKYRELDAFIICYRNDGTLEVAENSHKLMEYLSTGKVVVSSYLSVYENNDLIEMDKLEEDQGSMQLIFQKVISNLDYYNREEILKKRILYALRYTYDNNIKHIATVIESLLKKSNS